jgi:hypothetical protein
MCCCCCWGFLLLVPGQVLRLRRQMLVLLLQAACGRVLLLAQRAEHLGLWGHGRHQGLLMLLLGCSCLLACTIHSMGAAALSLYIRQHSTA